MEGDREIVEYGVEEGRDSRTWLGGSGRERKYYHCRGERGCNIVGGREIDYDSGKREQRVGGGAG